MEEGRLEDVMRLAVKTPEPVMIGGLRLETTFDLPPGDRDVVDKLRLDGRFSIREGRFTNAEVQRKINEMSLRASGKLRDRQRPPRSGAPPGAVATSGAKAPAVTSDFEGRFQLADGTLTLPSVAFDIPGAAVRLSGRYGLQSERIAFAGNLYMDASVSETVTGWKSWLLKVADPLFRRQGQTVVPIRISGSRREPKFGVDFGRVF
jgi:hypothetical protein